MVRAWHGHGMASVNLAWPHCVCQMGKTHSKPLAAGHGRERAWARHAMCESALRMHGAITLLHLYAFMPWAGATLPFTTSCHPHSLRFI
jgi:hypothetical protein